MKIIDNVADMLLKDGCGFFVVQYDSHDGGGIKYRYKADDEETMLGFLVPIVDSICNEYVENEGYLVCESIRQTVEKTMQMNDKRPSEEMFEKNIALLREICKNAKWKSEDDDNSEKSDLYRNKNDEREAVTHLDRFCKSFCIDVEVTDDLEFRCQECPFLTESGQCQVKIFKCIYAPDYKEFGAMGDL